MVVHVSGVLGVFSAIVAPFDQPLLFYTGFSLSLIVFPIATILVSIFFRKLTREFLPNAQKVDSKEVFAL